MKRTEREAKMSSSLECSDCAVAIPLSQGVMVCSGGCGKVFCYSCSKLKKTETKVISENKNIKWFCNQCDINNIHTMFVEIKHMIHKINEEKVKQSEIEATVNFSVQNGIRKIKKDIMENLYLKIKEDIQMECEKLKNDMSKEISEDFEKKTSDIMAKKNIDSNNNNNNSGNRNISYAQIVQDNEKKIILKPKNKEKRNKEIKDKLKNVVEPTQGLINNVKELNSGGLVIECSSKEAFDTVQKELNDKIGQEYEVGGVHMANKKYFKIIGLTNDISEDRLIECIKKQNATCEEKEFKVIKKYTNTNTRRENYSAIIETDVNTYDNLVNNKKIRVEYDMCRVFTCEQTILRCFKCLGFNHKAINCTNRKACGKCGGTHEIKDCISNDVKCINCEELVKKGILKVKIDHYAFSRNCPAMQKYVKENKNRKNK